MPSNSVLARAMMALGAGRYVTYLGARNQRDGDSSKEILSAPAMDLKVLNELRNFLLEHVFPSLQLMHVLLASYRRRMSKESLLLKKECYCRVLRTLWVRCCTNEDIGREMNVISNWLLQYVRRKKRIFPSCNLAVCVPRKGRIVWRTI